MKKSDFDPNATRAAYDSIDAAEANDEGLTMEWVENCVEGGRPGDKRF
jgi:hypothetical protein